MLRGDRKRDPEKGPYKGRGRLKGSRKCKHISQGSKYAILSKIGIRHPALESRATRAARGSKHASAS